ncbi:MAG: nucleotidyltransferase family protein [Actinomycetota bacterium]
MGTNEPGLFGRTRQAVLGLLLEEPDREFYIREITGRLRLGHGSVQRELSTLTRLGLLLRERRGNRVFYHANSASPLFPETRALVSKLNLPAHPHEVTLGGTTIPLDLIEEVCRRHRAGRLAVFGSELRGEVGPGSDVDLLVDFEKGYTPGFDFFEMEAELSDLLGRRVDLNTPAFLGPEFRDRVVAEAKVIYEPD